MAGARVLFGGFPRTELVQESRRDGRSREWIPVWRVQLVCGLVTADVEIARLEWENAHRDLAEAVLDPAREESLNLQLEAVTMELRRRVGGTFTLQELAAEYARADAWSRSALAERAAPGWPRTLSLVEGAAFHLYSRGAADYAP